MYEGLDYISWVHHVAGIPCSSNSMIPFQFLFHWFLETLNVAIFHFSNFLVVVILAFFWPVFFLKKNFLFCIGVEPINDVVMVSGEQLRSSAIQIHVSILPQILLPSRLPHRISRGPYAIPRELVAPCCLSILNTAVCTCPSQTPCHFHLVAISLFCKPVSLFLISETSYTLAFVTP